MECRYEAFSEIFYGIYKKYVNLLPICIIIYVKKTENLIKFVLLFENTYDII